ASRALPRIENRSRASSNEESAGGWTPSRHSRSSAQGWVIVKPSAIARTRVYHASVALVEPAPPDPAWPRTSTRPFPPYRFVAGLNAHPRRDPKGHAYGQPETPPPYVAPERWREDETYLYG